MGVYTVTYPIFEHSNEYEIVKKVGEVDILVYVENNVFRARQRTAKLLAETRKEEETVSTMNDMARRRQIITDLWTDDNRRQEFETIEKIETIRNEEKKKKRKKKCKGMRLVTKGRNVLGAIERLGNRIWTFFSICK